MIHVGVSQRSMDPNDCSKALFVFRNFTLGDDRYTAQFNLTVSNSTTSPVTGLQHGSTFSLPAGSLINVVVEETSGNSQGETATLILQPYVPVAPKYNISHFYHEETKEIVWAIGNPVGEPTKMCVLKSEDYFTTCVEYASITVDSVNNSGQYQSIYRDLYGNLIINWRPGPMILRAGKFEQLFSWLDPDNGILCPFWNITEDDKSGLLIISEYGRSLSTAKPHGSHRGTFWSRDKERKVWSTNVVDAGLDSNDVGKFGGYFRHIHGYHINPDKPNVHHMFLGDPAEGQSSAETPGYYVSQDGGKTWSDEIIRQWPGGGGIFYNGPCFITWWPNGKAFITSDTGTNGHAFWWGSGPDWGGPAFNPVIELHSQVDEESEWPDTPWMAMAVKDNYETYCTTSSSRGTTNTAPKEILWRYDYDPTTQAGKIAVLAEAAVNSSDFVTLKWLSGSRHNRIPAQARYFFTSGNRRFPRI